MSDKFASLMREGKEYIGTQEFEEARAAFAEALRHNAAAPEVHYYFAFSAAEEIGGAMLMSLTDKGISLGKLGVPWRDALNPAMQDMVQGKVEKVYGKKYLRTYRMAVAAARVKVHSMCVGHLRKALALKPDYNAAHELLQTLEPLAANSPLALVAAMIS